MPTGDVEEATAPARRSRRTAKLDTSASRRFVENALGIPSTSRNGDTRIIMPKSLAAGKSRRAKSKAARGEQKQDEDDHPVHPEGEQDMNIDEEEESGGGNNRSLNSTMAEVDASIDHLNSVLRRYIPKPKSRNEGDQVDTDEVDDKPDSDNAWDNPMQAFRDIQEARERMMDACDKHEEHVRSQQAKRRQDDEVDSQCEIEEEFRALYMNTMTTAFAAELDDIRTGRASAKNAKRKKGGAKKPTDAAEAMIMDADNMFVAPDHTKDGADEDPEEKEQPVQENIDVEVLVDILQGGMSSFSVKERKMLVEESRRRRRKNEVAAAEEEEDVMTPHERRRKMLGF